MFVLSVGFFPLEKKKNKRLAICEITDIVENEAEKGYEVTRRK